MILCESVRFGDYVKTFIQRLTSERLLSGVNHIIFNTIWHTFNKRTPRAIVHFPQKHKQYLTYKRWRSGILTIPTDNIIFLCETRETLKTDDFWQIKPIIARFFSA